MHIVSLIILLIFIFIGLIFIFSKVMTKNVISATQHIEELNQEYIKKEQEINRQLEEAKFKSESIIKTAQEDAEKLKTQIIKDAENERDKILTQAREQSAEIIQQAEKSRQVLLAEIDQRILENAFVKAVELIRQVLPEQLREKIHHYWVDDLISSDFGDLDKLYLPKGILEVKTVSAFKLNDAQRTALRTKIEEKLGRQVNFKEEVSPDIIAGLLVNIGSLVLDGSLKNQIRERTRLV